MKLIGILPVILSEDDLVKIHAKQKTIVENQNTKEERNQAILKAYNDSHTQVDISKYTKLSESSISKIVNS
jgi:hypothetical protein